MSIIFFLWWVSFSFNKALESWIINWWNPSKSKFFLNDIVEKLIKFEEFF